MRKKTRLVVCGFKRIFDLICRTQGWNPRETVYCSAVERMVGRDPESVIVVYGHEYWKAPEAVQDRAELYLKLGAEKIHVST